jgi:3-oxoacyl-[acyl-carrier-protein] synthase III
LLTKYNGTPAPLYANSKDDDTDTNDDIILSKSGTSYIEMNGQEVFKFATRSVPSIIKEALIMAELEVEDIDYLGTCYCVDIIFNICYALISHSLCFLAL